MAVSKRGKTEYWVAVQQYQAAHSEFFENHFTDAMEWKNEWKKSVAPQCQDAK
jgi:hypothetical protein